MTSSPCLELSSEKIHCAMVCSSLLLLLLRLAETQGSNAGSGQALGQAQPRPLHRRSTEDVLCRCFPTFPAGACTAEGKTNGWVTILVGL